MAGDDDNTVKDVGGDEVGGGSKNGVDPAKLTALQQMLNHSGSNMGGLGQPSDFLQISTDAQKAQENAGPEIDTRPSN